MKILGLCGSLRDHSSNGALLKAAREILKDHAWETVELSKLPYFDPDQQYSDSTPEIVLKMRETARTSDLIFISTPEYAHGVPGILKNALEWLFYEGTQKKPVAIVIGSAQGEWARDQLLEILTTMDFVVSPEEILLIKGARAKISGSGVFTDELAREEFVAFCNGLKAYAAV